MGRVLDTLKQSESARGKATKSVAPTPPVEECVVDWTLDEGEVPFIEVGAPGKKVEASPNLVHPHPPQPSVQPPHATVAMSEAQPLLVAYEPWPRATPWVIAPEVIAYHRPDHAVSQDYAALCTKILAPVPAQVLLLTGVRPCVGTTTVLLNLAVTAARLPAHRVALLEANGARPALAARLGQATAAGVHEVLAGRLALEQAICATPLPALSLLPAGANKLNGTLTSEAIAWLLAWLRERFDVILMDGPSLDDRDAVAALAPSCDGMYFVLPHGETPAQHKGLTQTLPRLGGRLRGLIHTRFEI
jgi:Mrp family chromosome partitioning ATPase